MSYVSNCLADIEIRARQRAFLRRGGKITEVPGLTAMTQQQRIAASVADTSAKLSAWRGRDGRRNNRNAKRLKQEVEA